MSPPADLRTECEEPRTRAQRVPDSSACSAVVRPPPEAERAKPLQMAQGNVHVRSPPAALRARTRCSARVCLALAPRQKNMMQVLLGAGAMAEDDLLSKLQECIELHQDAARRAKLKFVDNKEQDKATLDAVISVLNTQLDPLGLKVCATARVCPCGMSPCDMGTQACDMGMSPCDTLNPCDSGCMPTWQQDGSDHACTAAVDGRDPVPSAGHRWRSSAASTTTSRCTTASSTCGRTTSSSWAPTWTRTSRSSFTRSCAAARVPGEPEHAMRARTRCAPLG